MKRKTKYKGIGFWISEYSDVLIIIPSLMIAITLYPAIILWFNVEQVGILPAFCTTAIIILGLIGVAILVDCDSRYANIEELRKIMMRNYEYAKSAIVLCKDISLLHTQTADIDEYTKFKASLIKNPESTFGYEVKILANLKDEDYEEIIELDKFLENFEVYHDIVEVPNI